MSIATALQNLDIQRDNLAAILTAKGVTSSNTETLAQLVLKVLNISEGEGGSIETISLFRNTPVVKVPYVDVTYTSIDMRIISMAPLT